MLGCKSVVCSWLHLSCTKYPGGITCWNGHPTIFFFTSAMSSKTQGGAAEWGRKVRFACELTNSRVTQVNHQLPCKWEANQIQNRPKVKEGSKRWQHRCVFAYEKLGTISSPMDTVARAPDFRLTSFTTTATAVCWGKDKSMTSDIIVEAAPKTILLCAGEEPRRGLAGQRLLSVDQPATAAVSTSVSISATQFSMKADIALGQRINTFTLNPLTPGYRSPPVCLCVCVCVSLCLSMLTLSSGTQGWRRSRRRAPEKET